MTDEQIRQNAEEYYDKLDSITIEVENEPNSIVDAYIAGAHSRDEEIEGLKEVLSTRKAEIEDMEFKITKLEHEKALLRQGYKLLEDKLNKLDPEWMTK